MRALKVIVYLIVILLAAYGAFDLVTGVMKNKPDPTTPRVQVVDVPDETPADTTDEATPEEGVVPAEATPEEPAPASDATVYAISLDDSALNWIGYKPVGPRYGGFGTFGGAVAVQDGDITTAKIEITVDVTSLYSDAQLLTDYLARPDFFNPDEFPEATFVSVKVEEGADGYDVTGDLTLRGVTKRIKYPAEIALNGDELTASAEFVISRAAWGMDAQGYEDSIINDEVTIQFEILATPES